MARSAEEAIASNKQWMRRLRVVMEMEEWVAGNLKKKGEFDTRDRSKDVLLAKGKEYFYGYLFWGRRVFSDSDDPLFFDDDGNGEINDGSLIYQLKTRELYNKFIEKLRELKQNMMMVDVEKEKTVNHTDIKRFVNDDQSKRMISFLETNLPNTSSKDHEIIGLILRYRCVGGFESNLHGSVTAEWASKFQGYTECFASPLNHKFEAFHSVFEEDRVFGGQGDFFKMVNENDGVLPSGNYEINPPFHSALLDQVAAIVDRSFKRNVANLKIVMVVPVWSDTIFIPLLDNVCKSLGDRGYVCNERYSYNHTNGRPLSANTNFYFLASNDIPVDDFFNLSQIV